MPGARTHDKITLATGAALVPLGYIVLLNQTDSPQIATLDTALRFAEVGARAGD